jgi:molybdopterin-guanine dinucleotide biosynthesis protein A
MGAPKAWLPVGGEPMLARAVRAVGGAVGRVVVVAAPGQDVPPLPTGVRVVRDEVDGRGPLGGLSAGLAALAGAVDAVYLSSCDVPLLTPEFVRRVVALLEEPAPAPFPSGKGALFAAVPRVGGRLHPLAAAYRVEVLPAVRAMLTANNFRMTDLLDRVPTRVVEARDLAAADPALGSLRNVNTPEEYAALLGELGPAPGAAASYNSPPPKDE